MEKSNSYFRSYIRRYACTSDEILNALKKSGESEKQIFIEITTGQADYVNTEYNQSTDDGMIVLTPCKSDPDRSFNCVNNGTCWTDGYYEFCQCIPGFRGRYCQYSHNPKYEGALHVAPEVESAALKTMFIIIIIGFIVACCILYFCKTYCKVDPSPADSSMSSVLCPSCHSRTQSPRPPFMATSCRSGISTPITSSRVSYPSTIFTCSRMP